MNIEDVRKLAEYPQLKAENARLRAEMAALAAHHREQACAEVDRQETDDLSEYLSNLLSGKITVRRAVATSIDRILSSVPGSADT